MAAVATSSPTAELDPLGLHFSKEPFYTGYSSFIVPRGDHMKVELSRLVNWMHAAGLFGKIR